MDMFRRIQHDRKGTSDSLPCITHMYLDQAILSVRIADRRSNVILLGGRFRDGGCMGRGGAEGGLVFYWGELFILGDHRPLVDQITIADMHFHQKALAYCSVCPTFCSSSRLLSGHLWFTSGVMMGQK